jgi:hypothetical protein
VVTGGFQSKDIRSSLSPTFEDDKLLFYDVFHRFLPADVLKREIGRGHCQLNDGIITESIIETE